MRVFLFRILFAWWVIPMASIHALFVWGLLENDMESVRSEIQRAIQIMWYGK